MIRTTACVVVAGMAFAVAAWADDRGQAVAVLDRAIKAHGGEAALTRAQVLLRTGQGEFTSFGKGVAFTDELLTQLPDRFRLTVELGTGAQKNRVLQILDKDRGWSSAGGMAVEVRRERLAELREDAFLLWVITLVPLKQADTFTLTPLPEASIDGRPADGVEVKASGHATVKLYFDRESHLLVKSERRVKEAGATFTQEHRYFDHKEFDGVRLPTCQAELRDGKKFTELTGITYRLPGRVDSRAFEKP